MGLFDAVKGAVGGALSDQWRDIFTAGHFDEHTVVAPGVLQKSNGGRGSNTQASTGVITNGSLIRVPENTAAFIFSQAGIEEIINEPGEFAYQNGEDSLLNGASVGAVLNQAKDRFTFGGQPGEEKHIAFVNLREIRDIKFGTRGPLVYNDAFYGTDLEVLAFGAFSVQVTNPEIFIRNFVPANVSYYSFDDEKAKGQVVSEFIQSFIVAVNSLSAEYRISQLPGQAQKVSEVVANDTTNAGTWPERFGFKVVRVGIENIEFSQDSKALVNQYSQNKMNVKAFEDVSQQAANIAAQQKIEQGVQENGLGDGAGMIFGMNYAGGLGNNAEAKSQSLSMDEQIETLKKLKELLDAGILTQEEFDKKKSEVMGI